VSLPIPPGRVTPDNAEHFEGLAAGKLLLPRCERCGAVIWYPRHFCPACGSLEVGWFEASGRGTLYSFSIVRRGQGAYAEAGPYVLAYVELAEGPRVMTNLLVDPEEFDVISIGQPVQMVIEKADGAPPLVRFKLA
jgi:uncharacterized OB-fold protein